MPHLMDPTRLKSETDYLAALDELEDLMLCDPDTPAGQRFDELVALIEAYEAAHWPPETPSVNERGRAYAVTAGSGGASRPR